MASHTADHGQDQAHAEGHHVSSPATLITTFVALIALTVLTVSMAQLPFGRLDMWITLGIATVKAALVALFFMHLLYDKLFNGVILISALVFMTLFIGITLLDSEQYQPEVKARVLDVEAASAAAGP